MSLLPRHPAGAPSHAPDRLSSATAGGRPFQPGPIRRAAYEHVGAAIRHYRLGVGWTRERLAQRSGYAVSTVQAWEDGRYRPRPCALRDVAQALRVSKAELLACRVYLATRSGPWETGRACESGWSWEEVAA